MHNSTNDIKDEVVEILNKLASHHQTRKFRKAFNNLNTNHKQDYCYIVEVNGNSLAMSRILMVMAKDQAVSAFHDLLAKNQDCAFNTLDGIAPQSTLFKTLFDALDLCKNEYIKHVKAKPKGSRAMSGILNVIGKEDALSIFNQLLQENKEFAFNTLDSIGSTYTLFKTLFDALDLCKNEYIKHVKAKPKGSRAMSGVLNALKKEEACRIFNWLLKDNEKFAFNTLDGIAPQSTLFKTLFDALGQYKNEYMQHVKEKSKGSTAMFGILKALRRKDALQIFNQLLQENKKFAFNTLDCIKPQYTLLRTLLNQLNPQQKEDYKVHLETKTTIKAKLILRNFYLNNKESSNNLNTKNFNEDSLLLVQKRKRDDLNEFSELSPANFFSSSVMLDEMVEKYGFNYSNHALSDLEEVYIKQPAKCQCMSVNSFLDFAILDNQFSNIVPSETEFSTVSDSAVSEEHTSLESELTFHDISSELENQSCDELISWVNEEQSSSSPQFSIFDRLGDLEEIHLEQPAKLQYILPR